MLYIYTHKKEDESLNREQEMEMEIKLKCITYSNLIQGLNESERGCVLVVEGFEGGSELFIGREQEGSLVETVGCITTKETGFLS